MRLLLLCRTHALPLKKRKLKKRASKAGSNAPMLGQAEGMDEADLTDFYAEIENSLERDEGTSTRSASAHTPRLGKRLGAPPSMVVVSASGPSHVGTSVHASTSGRSFSLGDPLDFLAHSALARNVEYDQISEDDFVTTTRGEEINLTLFPLTPGPYQMSYPYEDLANRFNFLSALLVSHGAELNSCYTGLVTARNRLQEKFDRKAGYVKVLRSEVTDLDGKLERMRKDYDALVQENKELRSQKDDASDKGLAKLAGFEEGQILRIQGCYGWFKGGGYPVMRLS
ncbi:hypothetical protein Tco_1366832 [Tanacetum coccineum]